MNRIEKLRRYGINIFCWLVKGAGLALLGLVLAIVVGEGPPNPFELTRRELLLFVSLLVTLAGIVLALWQQLMGGLAMLIGMIPFIGESGQWIFWAFAITGILNVLCWWPKKLYNKCD